MRSLLPIPILLVGLSMTACLTTPCDDYVDYICDCHADDDRPGYDCSTLRRTYANADPELQDDCAVALDEQIEQDEAEGYECATGDTGTP